MCVNGFAGPARSAGETAIFSGQPGWLLQNFVLLKKRSSVEISRREISTAVPRRNAALVRIPAAECGLGVLVEVAAAGANVVELPEVDEALELVLRFVVDAVER